MRLIAAPAAILTCLFSATVAAAQDAGEGAALYAQYCAACHGPDAGGDGPLAEMIAIETPDLTALSARNDGVFPMLRIAEQIDGRTPLRAHTGAMPLFGGLFEGDDVAVRTDSGQPMMTSRPIADLLSYLESIQRDDI